MKGQSGAARASKCIRAWCHRHDDHVHAPSAESEAAAQALPLVHVTHRRGLSHMQSTGRLEPAPNRSDVFLFVGPSRRKPQRAAAAALVFRAGFEESSAVKQCESSQYDSGGAEKYAGMSRAEKAAAMDKLTMVDSDLRAYLATFLDCAFEAPLAYLGDEPGPDLTMQVCEGPEATGLAKALGNTDNPSCWTVEARIRPESKSEINLAEAAIRDELDSVLVIGADNEALASQLENDLSSELVHFVARAVARLDEDGLVKSLVEQDQRHLMAREWTASRCRELLETP